MLSSLGRPVCAWDDESPAVEFTSGAVTLLSTQQHADSSGDTTSGMVVRPNRQPVPNGPAKDPIGPIGV
jgi:hypothetical protein